MTIQMLLLLGIAIITTSFFKSKIGAWAIATLFSILFSFQAASILFGGNLIDYKFFTHLNIEDVFFAAQFFIIPILIISLCPFLISFLIYKISRKWQTFSIHWGISLSLIALSIALMCLKGGMLRNLYDIGQLMNTADKPIDQALLDVGISPSDYTFPEQIEAKAGKNIIVISLESLEQGFLSPKLKHLTPHLSKMKSEQTFFNMPEGEGSDWTSGSVYTEITGFPCLFKGEHNTVFQKTSDVKISGISHVLNKAGYDLTYLLAGEEFAGMGALLEAYGFNVKSDADYAYELSEWGIRDRDLFDAAKQEILAAKDNKNPFALFMSTIDTHYPDGVYDKRFETSIEPQRSRLEFMVKAVDQMIGDLFVFLEKEGILDNTAVYIFPDHSLMGLTAEVLPDFPQPRSLYLLSNVADHHLSYKTYENLYQIDIPKLILEGAEVQHNVKFLTDYIGDAHKATFIAQNKSNILALNEASLRKSDFKDGLVIQQLVDKSILLKSPNHIKKIPQLRAKNRVHVFTFDKSFRLENSVQIDKTEAFERPAKKLTLIVDIKKNGMFAYLKNGILLGIAKHGDSNISFSAEDINIFSKWNLDNEVKMVTQKRDYIKPYDFIYLTSTGKGLAEKKTPTEIRIGTKSYPTNRGINVLIKVGDRYKVQHYDTYEDEMAVKKLLARLKELKDQKTFFALIAHDSAEKMLKAYKEDFQKLGFNQLARIKRRAAYLAYVYKGRIAEFENPQTVSLTLPLIFPETTWSEEQLQQQATDVNRFIAHAGGQIEGNNYSNSLEALNLSYKNGFRLFELDIIKTIDGDYVAAHDWKQWQYKTHFRGAIPPRTEEFLKQKMYKKYTAMDMTAINDWFRTHPDAILITDKVNKPTDFADQFIDKSRLMMELFTMEAVKEGLSIGIKSAIPSMNVIEAIKGDKVAVLKDLGVQHVAVSRRMLQGKETFFKALQAAGIKAYLYHINADKGKNETYVFLHELDMAFGMYADIWNGF